MTNGHWEKRRQLEEQAAILYAQGRTQEADLLLGKDLHPGYIPVAERVTEPEPAPTVVEITQTTSWYWVKYPSGKIEYMKISEDLKNKWLGQGYVISRSKIEGVSQEPVLTPIPAVHVPELIPDIQLSSNVIQIINALETGKQLYPDWFNNNINWVKDGHMSEQEFLTSYYYLSEQGLIHAPIVTPPIVTPPIVTPPIVTPPIVTPPIVTPPIVTPPIVTPPVADSITDNMVTQQVINFNIINGRAVGSIKFVATNNFNPFYYGQNIVNIIQFKDPNGVNILTYVKENRLNFTETERDEVITYDEDMQGNTRATVESFVWSSATAPTPFSKMYSIEISEAEPPKPIQAGFMGAGIAGAIAGLILIGFIADHKSGK